jgi:hypothetical protein
MTQILADRATEKRAAGEALIREADDLACQSWNERMWADGGPIDPSPTIDQAIHGELHLARSRLLTPQDAAQCRPLRAAACTVDLYPRSRRASALRESRKAGKRPPATLHQLAQRKRPYPGDEP